jgi:hypothetical protein
MLNPKSRRCDDDLELLASMLPYYSEMSSTLGPLKIVALKLGETARAFHKLAEYLAGKYAHVRMNNERQTAINRLLSWYPTVSYQVTREMSQQSDNASPTGSQPAAIEASTDRLFDWFLWDSQEVPMVPLQW